MDRWMQYSQNQDFTKLATKDDHTALSDHSTLSSLQSEHAVLQQRHKALADAAEGLRLTCQSAEGRVLLAQQLNADRLQELTVRNRTLTERCVSLGALAEQHRIAHARQETESKGLAVALAQQEAKHHQLLDKHTELQKLHAGASLLEKKYADLQRAHAGALLGFEAKCTDLQKLHASLLLREDEEQQKARKGLAEAQERCAHLEQRATEELRSARERESGAARELEKLKSIHRSKGADAQWAARQAAEAGQAKQRALEARVQRMEVQRMEGAGGLDREGIARELQRSSDALCLARENGGVADLRASIREANAALLGLRWRLVHE
jgi:hypothetical protein